MNVPLPTVVAAAAAAAPTGGGSGTCGGRKCGCAGGNCVRATCAAGCSGGGSCGSRCTASGAAGGALARLRFGGAGGIRRRCQLPQLRRALGRERALPLLCAAAGR